MLVVATAFVFMVGAFATTLSFLGSTVFEVLSSFFSGAFSALSSVGLAGVVAVLTGILILSPILSLKSGAYCGLDFLISLAGTLYALAIPYKCLFRLNRYHFILSAFLRKRNYIDE
jgi:hypothetical protein